MMKKKILFIFIAFALSMSIQAQTDGVDPLRDNDDVISGVDMRHWNFDVRLGYSVGGTIPVGFPEGIRKINSFAPKINYRFGVDIEYRYNTHWGLSGGMYFERKGFMGDAAVKQYDVRVSVGGESISGPYTGNVQVNVIQTEFTVPIQVSWWLNRKLKLKFGPYVSLVTDRSFYGYAYGDNDSEGNPTAYMRRGSSSNAPLVYIGNDETTRGYFTGEEFNRYMRRFQVGLNWGADWYFSRHWGLFLDLSYGINSAFNNDPNSPVNIGLHPLYATFGLVYKIGR